jgi:divalent metal cation (Fe/Co/Zn/Cd) transporter
MSHDHPHVRPGRTGVLGRALHGLRPHSHEPAQQVDAAMEASAEGMHVLWVSLAVLAGTAAVQAVVVAVSGSVALLGDTLHNAADALTAVPLGIAFIAARRPSTRRYTYGYGRAEDLAGVVIVLLMAASSAFAAFEAVLWQAAREIYRRLMDAVDLALTDRALHVLRDTPGVLGTGQVRLRWIGHRLRAECEVTVDPSTSIVQAHHVAVAAEHALLHALPGLSAVLVHADPQPSGSVDHHAMLASHRRILTSGFRLGLAQADHWHEKSAFDLEE